MRVINADVKATSRGTFIVSWSGASAQVDVMKSYCPESGFKKVHTSDGVSLSWEDLEKELDPNRVAYYRIVSGVDDSKIIFLKDDYDGVLDTIKYSERILNKYYQGSPYYILKLNKHTERCDNCWDQYREEATIGNCPVCHGTTYKVGVFDAIEAFIATSSRPVSSTLLPEGEDKYPLLQARMSSYPIVDTGDIIVSKEDNSRYIIVGAIDRTKLPVQPKTKDGTSKSHMVSQMFNIRELSPDHQYYQIVVDFIEGTTVS